MPGEAGPDRYDGPFLGLSFRTRHALEANGITSVEEIVGSPALELLRLPCLGRWQVEELRAFLARRGLSLAGEPPPPPDPVPTVAARTGHAKETLRRLAALHQRRVAEEGRRTKAEAELRQRTARADERLEGMDRAGTALLAELGIQPSPGEDWGEAVRRLGLVTADQGGP